MNKCFERYKLLNFSQEQIENQNTLTANKEIRLITNDPLTKKFQSQMVLVVTSFKHLRKN